MGGECSLWVWSCAGGGGGARFVPRGGGWEVDGGADGEVVGGTREAEADTDAEAEPLGRQVSGEESSLLTGEHTL